MACPESLRSSVVDEGGWCGASTCACLATTPSRQQVHPLGSEAAWRSNRSRDSLPEQGPPTAITCGVPAPHPKELPAALGGNY